MEFGVFLMVCFVPPSLLHTITAAGYHHHLLLTTVSAKTTTPVASNPVFVARPPLFSSSLFAVGTAVAGHHQMTTSSTNNSVFRGFFEKQKLTGPNFIDWYRQLRIVLSIEDKLNYLEQPIHPVLVAPAGQQVDPKILAAHSAWVKGTKEIAGLMLMTMKPEIQRNLEPLHAHEMLKELKTLFAQQAEQELLQTTRDFHSCRQKRAVSELNYNMHSMGKTVNELHAMLKLHEQICPKATLLLLMLFELVRSRKEISTRNRISKRVLRVRIKGKENLLPSPRFLLHLEGKISQRTLSAMSVERQDTGRGTVLSI
uniref:Zinc finger, CCHC-type n=1 Tax=Tanacetum cinerariifolium TaxID=118510 RepID=A0A6L2J659_TANCI|nr:zinc finger, CCHC-type [Tanacetum cinerariifolium]